MPATVRLASKRCGAEGLRSSIPKRHLRMSLRHAAQRLRRLNRYNDRSGADETLPDLLREKLEVAFVGINPSCYSAARGRYFARPTNRFWPCLSRSTLSLGAREGLGVDKLGPEHDRALLAYGIGFTDVVKRATPKAGDLAPAELADGVHELLAKLDRYRPRVACFHGVTGFRHVHRLLTGAAAAPRLGPQTIDVGPTRLFLVPNPSGANAHFTPAEQTLWYDRLAEFLDVLRR
jgi:TDG/mug DNA glycosylase family protein